MKKFMLHIDSSSDEAVVMISDEDLSICHHTILAPRTVGGRLNVAIQDAMDACDISFGAIAAISLVNGPGSYTGLRIGLTTAKALCYALDIPLILHHKLLLLSTQYINERADNALIILYAREGEYFIGHENRVRPQHISHEGLIKLLAQELFDPVLTNVDLGAENDKHHATTISLNLNHWIQVAWDNYRSQHFADINYAEPFYLKPAFISTPKNNILHKN